MRLSLALGEPDPDQLAARLSPAQLQEWRAFERLEPFAAERTEDMLAHVCAVIANANRGKGRRAFTADEFKPRKRYEEFIDDLVRRDKGRATKSADRVRSVLTAMAASGASMPDRRSTKAPSPAGTSGTQGN